MAVSALSIVVAASVVTSAWAEMYRFDQETVPARDTFERRYVFYVHSLEDSPGPRGSKPQLSFSDMKLGRGGGEVPDDTAVAVGVLPWHETHSSLDGNSLCVQGSVQSMNVADAHWHQVKSSAAEHRTFTLERTGAYMLIIVNCGQDAGVHISGSVVLQNPYGFIAGNDYFKLSVYKWSALAYVAALLLWGVKMLSRRNALQQRVHLHITLVAVVGMLESVLYLAHFTQTIRHPDSQIGSRLSLAAEVMSIEKIAYIFLLFRLVTLETPTCKEQETVSVIIALLMLTAAPKVWLQSVRHQMVASDSSFVMAVLPVAAVGLGSSVWVVHGLLGRMRRFREVGEEKMRTLYQDTAFLAFNVVLASTMILWAQYLDMPCQDFTRWFYHALANDAAPQATAFAAIAAMMCMWQPSEDLRPIYELTDAGARGAIEDPEAGKVGQVALEPVAAVEFVIDDCDDDGDGDVEFGDTAAKATRAQDRSVVTGGAVEPWSDAHKA